MSEDVKCKICGKMTPYEGIMLCDRCWELESRIQIDPDIARGILAELNPTKDTTAAMLIKSMHWANCRARETFKSGGKS